MLIVVFWSCVRYSVAWFRGLIFLFQIHTGQLLSS